LQAEVRSGGNLIDNQHVPSYFAGDNHERGIWHGKKVINAVRGRIIAFDGCCGLSNCRCPGIRRYFWNI
jgi:hypothetical protein